jgi:hypothetical protein
MDKRNEPLFQQVDIGIGYHNVGRTGLLPASDEATQAYIEKLYGQRCGHIPMNAEQVGVLVENPTDVVYSQLEYLSTLCGRKLEAFTSEDIKQATQQKTALIVPYVNMPISQQLITEELKGTYWGLPGAMTYALKNKAEFYKLIDEIGSEQFVQPDYRTVSIEQVAAEGLKFLQTINELYTTANVNNDYPVGLMMRFAESDGNYGCALAYEANGTIIVVPNGSGDKAQTFSKWEDALVYSQNVVAGTMNPEKEARVVISRYIDHLDSPGMSLVLMEGYVQSLLWNGQLQKEGSKACVGTSSYVPKTKLLAKIRDESEAETAEIFSTFLKQTAANLGINFESIRGLANVDILIPTEMEKKVQEKLGRKNKFYFAECNARWTNYTDAIMAMVSIQRKEQTIASMQEIIAEGIYTIDKYALPKELEPALVREKIFEKDQMLQKQGIRIIVRMTNSPMGLILAGDVTQAEDEVDNLIKQLTHT